MATFYAEVHCPDCGEFRTVLKTPVRACPRCGNAQSIVLKFNWQHKSRHDCERAYPLRGDED